MAIKGDLCWIVSATRDDADWDHIPLEGGTHLRAVSRRCARSGHVNSRLSTPGRSSRCEGVARFVPTVNARSWLICL
jgi:hypothetical protein